MNIIIEMIKGIIIGIANVIPGLSGGTIAVSMGIYEKLIYCINNIFKKPLECLKQVWTYIVGILIGIILAVVGITYLFEISPVPTTMLFVGLVLGAVPTIKAKVDKKKVDKKDIIAFVLFMSVIIGMTFAKGTTVAIVSNTFSSYLLMLVLGIIAAATMVIPGVSGSMMLMVLGYYEFIMGQISNVIKCLASFNFELFWSSVFILIPFGIGIIIGIIAISKLIGWLLEKHEKMVYWGILGLVVASPFPIIINLNLNGMTFWSGIVAVFAFFVGAYSTMMLTKLGGKKNE